jgi:predicted RNase H-like HicB family nuclease
MLTTSRPFVAFIRRLAASQYYVTFPDFPGCASSGRTIAEARKNAEGALVLQFWHMRQTGQSVPSPSFMHEIASRAPVDALVTLIPSPTVSL